MSRKPSLAIVLASALPLFLCSGCIIAAAAAGAAGVLYAKGDLEAELAAPPQEVADAAESALFHMGIEVDSSEANDLDGRIVAHNASGDEILIKLEAEGTNSTRISIRVGTFGDESQSHRVLRAIEDEL